MTDLMFYNAMNDIKSFLEDELGSLVNAVAIVNEFTVEQILEHKRHNGVIVLINIGETPFRRIQHNDIYSYEFNPNFDIIALATLMQNEVANQKLSMAVVLRCMRLLTGKTIDNIGKLTLPVEANLSPITIIDPSTTEELAWGFQFPITGRARLKINEIELETII